MLLENDSDRSHHSKQSVILNSKILTGVALLMDGRSHGIRCFHFQQSRRPLHAASNSWYFSASFVLSCGRFDGALFSSSIVRRGRCAAAPTGVRCCCCCCACSGGRRLLTVVATRQVELRRRRRRRCPSFAHPVSPRRPRVTGSRAASVSALFHRSRFVLGLPAVLLRQPGHRVGGKKCFIWGRQLATVGLTRTIKMAAPGASAGEEVRLWRSLRLSCELNSRWAFDGGACFNR